MTSANVNEEQVVLITGCSSGIGRATALRLAGAGGRFRVVATARRREALAALEGAGCVTLSLDVTDDASMQAAVAEAERRLGRVDALVNNAGYSQSGAVETVPMAAMRRQFETNVFGMMRMAQLVLPGMRRRGRGRIVNLSSMGGKLAFPGFGAYHASKFAIEGWSDVLRFEVRAFGVDVVVIEPGLIKSGFGEAAASSVAATAGARADRDDPYALFNAIVARSSTEGYEKGAMARLAGAPDDVARAIQRALTVRRPRARYTVAPSARVLLALRRWLSDRAWDALMGTIVPEPARSRDSAAARALGAAGG